MAVFRYLGSIKKRENLLEEGTVVAKDEAEARQKLKDRSFDKVKLKKLGSIPAMVYQFTADIK